MNVARKSTLKSADFFDANELNARKLLPATMEVTVKLRLLLTSVLLMFVQIPAPRAQVTVDVVKITCEQLSMEELPFTSRDVILWLSGYYHREHDNTVIEPGAIKRDANNLNRYCYQHGEMTVMDAVKNMGLGK